MKYSGPAFPNNSDQLYNMGPEPGMTLRDWFAGQVASSICGKHVLSGEIYGIAKMVYDIADAMLKERERE